VLIVVIGVVIIGAPLLFAARTVILLLRALGAIDGVAIAEAITADEALDLARLARLLHARASGSVPARLLAAVTADLRENGAAYREPPASEQVGSSALARRLALAEEVAEIERQITSDVRVPRVAARLSTNGGLLAAALVMREGLGTTLPEGTDPLPFFYAVIEKGLTLAAVAVLGGTLCASLHRIAQSERRARIAEVDAIVEALTTRLDGPSPGVTSEDAPSRAAPTDVGAFR
jgi:hypothetical protein